MDWFLCEWSVAAMDAWMMDRELQLTRSGVGRVERGKGEKMSVVGGKERKDEAIVKH